MNWIKQNTFLSGFIAVMVIGIGVLGWLLYSASGHYDEVRADYETKVKELNRLETAKPYPEEGNLKIFDELKKEHAAAIQEFQKKVMAAQIPVEPISAVQFQNQLKEAVDRVVQKATAAGVKTPTGFYLGFEKYQTQPPAPEAAPALGRQLKALEFVVAEMVRSGVLEVTKFDRKPLPEEEGKGKKEKSDEAPAKGPKVEKGGKTAASVAYHPVQIEFKAEQSRFRELLNGLVAAKEHFLVPRLLNVKNEAEVAPQRVAAAGTPPVTETGAIPVIFGLEKVSVTLDLELVEFIETAAK
jgi:hypothetical protein